MNSVLIRHRGNPKLEITLYSGHFATPNSHNSHYIDITRMKHEHTMAREAGIELAQRYVYDKGVDTIVCLDGSEIIAAFLARHLANKDIYALNQNKNIDIITPEYDSNAQLIFRDNLAAMLSGKNTLLLISTLNSGRTAHKALRCIRYYGGVVQGIAAVFSTVDSVEQVPVYSLFSPEDIPGYQTNLHNECPLCQSGVPIDALVNSYGFSKLKP
jgi:orotate phosphoribosyltransferase